MYEAREQEDILAELQSYSKTPASKFEGTFEYDMLASNALEFAKVEIELEQAYKAAFAETSWGEYLTMRAAEFGVDRKLAQSAIGTVTLTGRGDVPEGSRFATTAGTVFQTTKATTIAGSGDVPIQAVVAGSTGNVAASTISVIPINIPGITMVTNKEPTHDGYDEETDEELLKRYYTVVRTPATSGNKYHYYNWAMSVEGVGDCGVIPLWNGPGTVKVIIIDSNHQIASADLVKNVYDYIESVRPIGADVTVSTPAPLSIAITADIKGKLNIDSFKRSIMSSFIKRALQPTYLSAAQVIDKIMDQNTVEDCDNVLLNGSKRINISADELPVVSEVTVRDISS